FARSRRAGGPHHNLDVATERCEKTHEALDGVLTEVAAKEAGDLRLRDPHERPGLHLSQPTFRLEPKELGDNLGLKEVRLRIRQAKVGEDILAAVVHF